MGHVANIVLYSYNLNVCVCFSKCIFVTFWHTRFQRVLRYYPEDVYYTLP